MTSNDGDQQQQSHFYNSDELPTSSNEVLKKRSHLLNNLLKPSLSLTSLPPQSPKEQAHETTSNTERPYNSLKVRILLNKKAYWMF